MSALRTTPPRLKSKVFFPQRDDRLKGGGTRPVIENLTNRASGSPKGSVTRFKNKVILKIREDGRT